jgi:hypothetical protein
MQQFHKFITWRLCVVQHDSGVSTSITIQLHMQPLLLRLGRGGSRVMGCGLARPPDHDQQRRYHHAPTVKPEAVDAVVFSWWWAYKRSKHVKQHIKSSNKLVKFLHLVGQFIWILWWCKDLPTSKKTILFSWRLKLLVPATILYISATIHGYTSQETGIIWNTQQIVYPRKLHSLMHHYLWKHESNSSNYDTANPRVCLLKPLWKKLIFPPDLSSGNSR